MAKVKNILFDLGNVLLPIDYAQCLASFQRFTSKKIDSTWFSEVSKWIFEKQEVGHLKDEDFFNLLRMHGEFKATDEQLKEAWNSLLLEIPHDRYALLQSLSHHYKLYLLSNTNHFHSASFEQKVLQQTGKSLQSFFVKMYYSHEIGLRKPDPACYQFVLEKSHLVAEETLFIDDNEQNAIEATLLGIHTIHLQKFDNLASMLKSVINF